MSTMKGDESVARLVTGYHSLSVSHRNKGAVIYHALQDGTNAPVALKVLRLKEPVAAPSDGEDLATMLRLSAHPHIVSILTTGVTTTGRPCVAMQYCQGGSYADILAARGSLPVARVVETGVAIASALAAAHAEGMLHGSVTPSNVLQTQTGPALTDFPISRPPDDLTGTLGMSTPYHSAPEVLLGGRRSEASDVYGLASTLWTLLAGHPPFARPGETELDFFAYRERALGEPAPPVAADVVPAELQAALDKALSQNPAHRYDSAEEFETALSAIETWISPEPQPAAPGQQFIQTVMNPEKSRLGWRFFDAEPDLDPPTLAARPHGAVDQTPDAARPTLSGGYSTVPEQAPDGEQPTMSPQYPAVSGSVPRLDYVLDFDAPAPAPAATPEPVIPAFGSTTSVPHPQYLIEQEFPTPEPAAQ
ncbi:serine/threonine-protein kinase, partial [Actinomadura sp. HBU206391]|uniref:serine/threonine-protein kinase n=1 Tax=Actinomadura sp. HBU206391 TaxID=2731692 RepID=UPI0016502A45